MEILFLLFIGYLLLRFSGGSSSDSSSSSTKKDKDEDLEAFLSYEAARHIIDPDDPDNFFNI